MKVIDKIKDNYVFFSKTEKTIAKYFLSDEIYNNENFNILDLSKQLKVGQATILRFVKKLGYQSYAEFKISLLRDLSTQENSWANDYPYETALKNALEVAKGQIDEQQYIGAAKKMYESDFIYIFGLGYSKLFAETLGYQLFRFGKKYRIVLDLHEMKMVYSMIQKNECIVVISQSGLSREILDVYDDMIYNKITNIAITQNKNSKITNVADYTIIIPATSSNPDNNGCMLPFIEAGVLALIFQYYMELDKENITKTEDNITASIADFNSKLQ